MNKNFTVKKRFQHTKTDTLQLSAMSGLDLKASKNIIRAEQKASNH